MSQRKESHPKALILAHELLGGKWKLRVLWHIIHGNNRFSVMLREMPEISQKVLGAQLKELEASGLIEKNIIEDRPPKIIEYHIAAKHENLIPLVEKICDFTEEYAKLTKVNLIA